MMLQDLKPRYKRPDSRPQDSDPQVALKWSTATGPRRPIALAASFLSGISLSSILTSAVLLSAKTHSVRAKLGRVEIRLESSHHLRSPLEAAVLLLETIGFRSAVCVGGFWWTVLPSRSVSCSNAHLIVTSPWRTSVHVFLREADSEPLRVLSVATAAAAILRAVADTGK